MDPTTLGRIRTTKAETSGTYVSDPFASRPTTLHRIPLYAVPVSGAGLGWVIDGSGLASCRRSAVSFELGYSEAGWVTNTRTARAESRGNCAVLQPHAVTKVMLTPAGR